MILWISIAAGSAGGAFGAGMVLIALAFSTRCREAKADREIRALVDQLGKS